MKRQDLLPLGSIVILKDGGKKLMIYGRAQLAAGTDEPFDYAACLWPEGNLSADCAYLFNHPGIETVVHRGYSDDEDAAILEAMAGQ